MKTLSKLLVLSLVSALPIGCSEPTNCTSDARGSLALTVVDADNGEPVDASVVYLVDGEEPTSAPEKNATGVFGLGLEVTGTFEVTVSAAGYETVTEEYEIDADECHVITTHATVELTPTP